MYNTTLIIAEIDLGEYIRDYREPEKFIGYCKQCDRYNSCWACPPFDNILCDYRESPQGIGSKTSDLGEA